MVRSRLLRSVGYEQQNITIRYAFEDKTLGLQCTDFVIQLCCRLNFLDSPGAINLSSQNVLQVTPFPRYKEFIALMFTYKQLHFKVRVVRPDSLALKNRPNCTLVLSHSGM